MASDIIRNEEKIKVVSSIRKNGRGARKRILNTNDDGLLWRRWYEYCLKRWLDKKQSWVKNKEKIKNTEEVENKFGSHDTRNINLCLSYFVGLNSLALEVGLSCFTSYTFVQVCGAVELQQP